MDEKVCFLSVSSPLPPEQCCRNSTACENIKIKLLAAIQHCRRGEGEYECTKIVCIPNILSGIGT